MLNDKTNKYAIAALKDKRASIASDIVLLKRQLRHCEDALLHVDATLKLLDPSIAVQSIPTKRVRPQRVHIFRQGELGRLIRSALRKAERALSTGEIAAAAAAEKGLGKDAQAAMKQRANAVPRGRLLRDARLTLLAHSASFHNILTSLQALSLYFHAH